MSDPVLARWPHRPLAGLPLAQQTQARDAETAKALEAYLSTGREEPTRRVIRL